jgi:flagellar basal-body rod protein FlgG
MPKGVYAAASAMWTEARSLDITARNLAHAQDPGYRRESMRRTSFAEQLAGQGRTEDLKGDGGTGVLPRGSWFSFAQGAREDTGAPLDLAINGEGFYRVEGPGNRVLLTRAAHFTTDAQGRITTPDGWPVQGQAGAITVPPEADRVLVDGQGRVSYESLQNGVRTATLLDQLRVVTVADPHAMTAVNGQYFDPGSQPQADARGYQVRQGYLEKANVEPIQELVEMISTQRRYEAAQRALREQGSAGQGFTDLLRGG